MTIKNTDKYYNLAISYRLQGDLDKAIEYSHKAITMSPGDPDTYYHLGFIYELKGNYNKAAECLLKVNGRYQSTQKMILLK